MKPNKHSKKKQVPKSAAWRKTRERYTWHLRPPYDTEFDRTLWWKGQRNVELEAALYELMRRHPIIPTIPPDPALLPRSEDEIPLPPIIEEQSSLRWTSRLAMKPWPRLTETERRAWKASVGRMKGVNAAGTAPLCVDVTEQAHQSIKDSRFKEVTRPMLDGKPNPRGWFQLLKEISDQELEDAIARAAVELHRQGARITALDQNLSASEAGSATTKLLALQQKKKGEERAHASDWLSLIAEFETDELAYKGAKAQVFARYKRIVNSVRFT